MSAIFVADDEISEDDISFWIDEGLKAKCLSSKPKLYHAQSFDGLFKRLSAIAANNEEFPKVIFLDLDLRGRQKGIDALKRIKNSPKFKDIPVVIYSQSNEEIDIKETGRLNANSYLEKGDGMTICQRFYESVSYWLNKDKFAA